MASKSSKTHIIEDIFNSRWNATTQTLDDSLVTIDDLKPYWPTGNIYAFFKDIVRNINRANTIWPQSILERGYTGRQEVGQGASFRFVPLAPEQTLPFISSQTLMPTETTPVHLVESTSLPLASRQLGRGDEPWLIQIAVRLRIIETHLALFSPKQFLHVDHLQMSVKVRPSEIDALFLATEHIDKAEQREVIVCCEAKSLRDDLVEEQLVRQIKTIFRQKAVTQDVALPIALKAVGRSRIYVVEFETIERRAATQLDSLTIVSEAVYHLKPEVPGIGK